MTSEILIIAAAGLLVYTYLGYPVILRILCALRPRKSVETEGAAASVSVVVCARNAETLIGRRIENLLAQEGMPPDYEVVIASDGSTDGTAEAARKAGGTAGKVRVIEFKENRGKAAVLNEVIPGCRGEIVVLADARQEFAPDAIRRVCRRFGDPAVGAVSGELIFRRNAGETASQEGVAAYWDYEKWLRRMESRIDSTCGCTGAIYAIRRELFRPIHPDAILDDIAIPLLILWQGRRVVFEEEARAYDEPSRDLAEENRRKVRTLAGNFQLCRLYPRLMNPFRNRIFLPWVSHKVLRLLCPWFLLLLLAASGVLARTELWSASLFLLQVVFYVLAFAGFVFRRRRAPLILSLPAAFVSLNGAAVLGLFRFLRGGLAGKWE